jgi:Ca2+-binding RTX toxin-like protein
MGMTFEGTVGADTVRGGAGDDLIIGHAGNDHLRGGLGADTFRFERADGNDVILGFTHDVDHLLLAGISPREVAMADTAAGLVITYGGLAGLGPNSCQILLRDVHELHAGDLAFV